MSQCSQLFVHMQDRGPITPLEAFRLYGILACHSRINELRARGHRIDCHMIRVGNKMVGQYSIFQYPKGATRSCESINGTASLAAARPASDLFEATP